MKERPIIMTAESIRAILDRRKIQTRRVMNPQPFPCDHAQFTEASWKDAPTAWVSDDDGDWFCDYCGNGINSAGESIYKCPFGQPGNRLWIREGWAAHKRHDKKKPSDIPPFSWRYHKEAIESGLPENRCDKMGKWRNAMYMPRWASRITLEVIEVRVEQVQSISEVDCRLEGCGPLFKTLSRDRFAAVWQSINGKRANGKYAWKKNPYIWAITFKMLKGESDASGDQRIQ
jgi:hypothetical protein